DGLAVAGYVFCTQAPPRSGTRGLAMTAAGLGGFALLLALVSMILNLSSGTLAAGPTMNPMASLGKLSAAGIIGLVGTVVGVAKLFTFFLFLKTVADHLRDRGVAKSVHTVMIL